MILVTFYLEFNFKQTCQKTSLILLLLYTLNMLIGCQDIMVDAQCGEVLYIPGVMTPTEVRPSYKT